MPRFQIPKNELTQNKTVRIPKDIIHEIQEAIEGTNCTFSAFVVEALRVALKDLKEQQSDADS